MPTNDTNIIKSDEENKSFEQQYKEIFEQLDEKYNAISKDIIQLNERRSGLLDKIRSTHIEYKSLLQIKEDNKLKEEDIKEMVEQINNVFTQLNESYVSSAKDIIQLNEYREEILYKIRSARLEYKNLVGKDYILSTV